MNLSACRKFKTVSKKNSGVKNYIFIGVLIIYPSYPIKMKKTMVNNYYGFKYTKVYLIFILII